MNQKVLDTRQRAQDLLAEAIAIWKQGNHIDQLEGLKDDPVFQLLISAVAYQANIIDGDIERMKSQVLDEYASLLTPYQVGHATPATAVIKVMPVQGGGDVMLDSSNVFLLGKNEFRFIPVLKTKVIAAQVASVTRIDGRHWEMALSFDSPVSDLSYFSFVIKNTGFRDLRATIDGKELPLVKPWDYGELPFSDIFSFVHESYEGTSLFGSSMLAMELFARHDLRIFSVGKHDPSSFFEDEMSNVKFLLEFEGIRTDFTFDKSQVELNPVLLTNIIVNDITLDKVHPIARIAGDSQLVQVLKPGDEQVYSDTAIRIRRVAADRFNQGSLVRLLSSLLSKVNTDYYAFSNISSAKSAPVLDELSVQMKKLMDMTLKDGGSVASGTYVMLENPHPKTPVSVGIKYLTTNGEESNTVLDEHDTFSVPEGLDSSSVVQIAQPVPGRNEVSSSYGPAGDIQYYLQTDDRIVTPSDIRKFCYKELSSRYAVVSNMIKSITISHTLKKDWEMDVNSSGYEIEVNIVVSDNSFVRRNFTDRIPQVEVLLAKMMQVRSTNIYPISVHIEVK